MKLLLTSEGLTTKAIQEQFLQLIKKSPSKVKVAFIATAADLEDDTSWIVKVKLPLLMLGINVLDDIDLKQYTEKDLYEKLKGYDVIWVNGGNTFYLLHWVKKSGFDKVMAKLAKTDKVYVGVSAGSILVAPTIEVAAWKGLDDPSVVTVEDLVGLHLVDFHIFVHFQEQWRDLVDEKSCGFPQRLVVLSNKQAVLHNGQVI